jgi:hypothetical protein
VECQNSATSWWNVVLSSPWFQNIASNLLTILIVAGVGWLIYFFTRRRRLLAFFGLKDRKRLVLYLSNVRVQSGGSLGIDGIPRAYSGTAIPSNETMLIPLFQRLFNFVIPGLTEQPGLLKWLLISDVAVESLPSPSRATEVEKDATFITVGSPAYNSASLRIEQALNPLGRFNAEYAGFSLDEAHAITDLRCGFIQRVIDQVSGQTAFYVAGMSSLGTTGAAYFLAARWSYLAEKYKTSKPFCVVVRINRERSSRPRDYV